VRRSPFASLIAAVLAMIVLAPPVGAAYPGQNGKIAFSSSRDDPDPAGCGFPCNFEIYSMNADGSGVTRLTNDPARDLDPAWSPDGTKIAFTRTVGFAPAIYVMNADGTGIHQVYADGAVPTWSPDGSEIAFMGGPGIMAVPASGGTPRVIAAGTCDEELQIFPCHDYQAPAWSPAGNLIATHTRNLESADGPTFFTVAIIRADGSGQVSQFSNGSSNPNWSPSATQLAFSAAPATPGNLADIWKGNPDGSTQTPITNTAAFENFGAWSPDGTRIAFTRGLGGALGTLEIYTASSSGGSETQLTNTPGDDTMPDWQPLPGPRRSDYKNAAQFCNAERSFLGDEAFSQKYGGEGAHGKCVTQNK
jgi:Tol biopolymer transport system component